MYHSWKSRPDSTLVGLDPCGRVVDVLRAPMTIPCRFFADRPDVVMDQIWYPASPGAPDMPWPHAFLTANDSYQQMVDPSTVGDTRRPYGSDYNGQKPIPTAVGSGPCGTEEEWQYGQVYDPDANFPKRQDGLLQCCGIAWSDFWGGMCAGVSDVSTAGGVTVVPGGPLCASAGMLPGPGYYRLEPTSPSFFGWWAIPCVAGVSTTWTADPFPPIPSTPFLFLGSGPDCAGIVDSVPWDANATPSVVYTPPVSGFTYFVMDSAGSLPAFFYVRVT